MLKHKNRHACCTHDAHLLLLFFIFEAWHRLRHMAYEYVRRLPGCYRVSDIISSICKPVTYDSDLGDSDLID